MAFETVNFSFLGSSEKPLVRAAAAAECTVFTDPVTSLMRLRQFGELLAQEAAARVGLYDEGESQLQLLRDLADQRVLTSEVADLFHDLRRKGNQATHDGVANQREALHQLRMARTLAVWFLRSFGKQPNLKVGKFVPPRIPNRRITSCMRN